MTWAASSQIKDMKKEGRYAKTTAAITKAATKAGFSSLRVIGLYLLPGFDVVCRKCRADLSNKGPVK
jgi:hypothetical protein